MFYSLKQVIIIVIIIKNLNMLLHLNFLLNQEQVAEIINQNIVQNVTD